MKKKTIIIISVVLVVSIIVAAGVLVFQHFQDEQLPSENTSQDTGEITEPQGTQPVEGNYGDVYVNFYGIRVDLSDREAVKGIQNRYGRLSAVFHSFEKYLEFNKGYFEKENGYTTNVVRVRCTGDFEPKLRPKEYNYYREYVTVPFEVVDVLEVVSGEESFVSKGDKISVASDSTFGIYMNNGALRNKIYNNYNYETGKLAVDITLDEIKKDKLVIISDSQTWAIIPRIGYEYIIVLKKYHKDGEYESSFTQFAIELSTHEDESSYKRRLKPTSNFTKESEENYSTYFEILERYNIVIGEEKK